MSIFSHSRYNRWTSSSEHSCSTASTSYHHHHHCEQQRPQQYDRCRPCSLCLFIDESQLANSCCYSCWWCAPLSTFGESELNTESNINSNVDIHSRAHGVSDSHASSGRWVVGLARRSYLCCLKCTEPTTAVRRHARSGSLVNENFVAALQPLSVQYSFYARRESIAQLRGQPGESRIFLSVSNLSSPTGVVDKKAKLVEKCGNNNRDAIVVLRDFRNCENKALAATSIELGLSLLRVACLLLLVQGSAVAKNKFVRSERNSRSKYVSSTGLQKSRFRQSVKPLRLQSVTHSPLQSTKKACEKCVYDSDGSADTISPTCESVSLSFLIDQVLQVKVSVEEGLLLFSLHLIHLKHVSVTGAEANAVKKVCVVAGKIWKPTKRDGDCATTTAPTTDAVVVGHDNEGQCRSSAGK